MFILDSLLIGSLRFVLDKIVAAAEAEAQDDTALREQLLEAQMRLELGEITDDEFTEIETNVIARMSGLRSRSPHSAGVRISSAVALACWMPSPVPMSCSSRSEKSGTFCRLNSGFALGPVTSAGT